MQAKKNVAMAAAILLLAGTFAALIGAFPADSLAYRTQCSDGLDNDNDGEADYPEDDDCEDLDDDFEGFSRAGTFVALTDGKSVAAPGEPLVYVITLRQQRDTHRMINVDFHLPAQIDLVSASDGGRIFPDGRVRFDNVTVFKDTVRTLTVNATVDVDAEQGVLLVSRVITDGESATDTTKVEAEREIKGRFHLFLSDGVDTAQPDDTLYYTMRVRNSTNATTTTDVRAVLSPFTAFLDASTGGERDSNNNVIWADETFAPGEERTYTFAVTIQSRPPNDYQLRARAIAGNANTADETVIKSGLPMAVLTSFISDGRNTVERGELLTYQIEVRNNSPELGTEEWVAASLPIYSEFVDVTEGGQWDGENVRWSNLQIAPSGVRKLRFTIRVRSDAPIGAELLATVQSEGGYDADHTEVVKVSAERGGNADGFDPSVPTRHESGLLLRKVAAGDEAVPGGELRYTIYVENVLPHALSSATVSDRFDPTYLRFLGSEIQGIYSGGNTVTISIPSLEPGQAWQTSYILAVDPAAPQGHVLTNVATISGPDIDNLPITQRVRTVHTGVLTTLPQTGAAWDVMATMLGVTLSLGLGSLQSVRKFSIGL